MRQYERGDAIDCISNKKKAILIAGTTKMANFSEYLYS